MGSFNMTWEVSFFKKKIIQSIVKINCYSNINMYEFKTSNSNWSTQVNMQKVSDMSSYKENVCKK